MTAMTAKKHDFKYGSDRRSLRRSPNADAAAAKTFGAVRYTAKERRAADIASKDEAAEYIDHSRRSRRTDVSSSWENSAGQYEEGTGGYRTRNISLDNYENPTEEL